MSDKAVTVGLVEALELLQKAAQQGLDIGKAGTEGDYTASGIAYYVFHEYVKTVKPIAGFGNYPPGVRTRTVRQANLKDEGYANES